MSIRRPDQHLSDSELASLRDCYRNHVRPELAAKRIGVTLATVHRHYRQFKDAGIGRRPAVTLAKVWEGEHV